MKHNSKIICLLIFSAVILSGCTQQVVEAMPATRQVEQRDQPTQAPNPTSASVEGPPIAAPINTPSSTPLEFVLETQRTGGQMVFAGVGGEIDGLINPDLVVQPGDTVRIVLTNGDGIPHDLAIPEFDVKTSMVSKKGTSTEVSFTIPGDKPSTYDYFCTLPGHRQAGQEGKLIVGNP
jgi:nitrite reductase (NO-forming)